MVSEGGSLLLFCLHSGSLPAAQIAWIRDGTVLATGGRVTISSDVLTHANPPQTTSSLSITSILPSESGSYVCRATNSLLPDQQIESSAAVITVQGKRLTNKFSQINGIFHSAPSCTHNYTTPQQHVCTSSRPGSYYHELQVSLYPDY